MNRNVRKASTGKISRLKEIISHPIFHITLILLASLVIIAPYMHSGFFPTHDGEWAVVRLAEMFREVRDGQFPARYSTYLNFGYGYPLFNFAYPLPYYVGLPFVLAGAGFVTSIKIIFAATVPFSALGMYLLARKVWNNNWAALVCSVLYIFLPYRLLDLYVRGSIGESVAFAIVPFLTWAGLKIAGEKKYIFIGLFGLLLAALLTSHNIMGLYFTPLVLLLIGAKNISTQKSGWKELLFATALGICASLFFILPALTEKSLIYLAEIPIANRDLYWVRPMQLIIPSWGYGTPTESNSFTYQLGIAHIAALISFGVFLIARIISSGFQLKKNIFPIALLLLTLGMVVLMFEQTKIVWQNIPLLKEINYPWTLLGPIGFCVSLAAGYIVAKIKHPVISVLALAVVAIVATYGYAQPSERIDRGEGFYTTNDATTTSSREYTPLWTKTHPLKMPDNRIEIVRGAASIDEKRYESDDIVFEFRDAVDAHIRINTIYFPGWKIFVNENEVLPEYSNDRGVMEVELSGSGHVRVEFTETPLRAASNIISLISIGALCICIGIGIYSWKK